MVVWMPIYVVQIYKSKRPSSANRSAGDLAAELLLTKPWVASGQSAHHSRATRQMTGKDKDRQSQDRQTNTKTKKKTDKAKTE